MIEIRGLKKIYDEVEALRGISTTIRRGEVVGLLGPNGAGKTTAMKILVGYLLPTAGKASVAGHDVVEEPLAVQRKIGYLPEHAPIYEDMLVQDYLAFMADMREVPSDTAERNIRRAVEDCGLGGVLNREIGHLSKGYRQRTGLAAALLHDPELLILDEPTTGLDPNQIVEVRDLIRRMAQHKTVILSTHILPEVEIACSRAVILIDGSIRADGTLDELTRSNVQVVDIGCDEPGAARETFERLPGVERVEPGAAHEGFHGFRLHLGDDRDIGELVARTVFERGWSLRELRRDDRTLEQVFRELTEGKEVPA